MFKKSKGDGWCVLLSIVIVLNSIHAMIEFL